MGNKVLENLIDEVKLLKNEGDNVGIKITNSVGIFIEVEENEDEEKEYFIEINNIDKDGCFEPIGENYCEKFGDFETIKNIARGYLRYN